MKGMIVRILCITLLSFAVVLLAGCGAKAKPAAQSKGGVSPVTAMLKANELEGRVVLVEFGTVGCELSGKGLDTMAYWQRQNTIPGLALLRLEPTRDKKVFDSYYSGKTLGFPVVRDTDMTIANALATTVFPRFALLDKFGRIRYRGSQPAEKDLADWTRQLESEKTDVGPNPALFGSAALDAPALLAGTRLPDLSGKVKPLAEYRGPKGRLLLFVDTKCPFSASASKEMPVVAASLAGHGIATVLVSIGDPEADVRKSYGANLPGMQVVYDNGKQTQQNWNVQFVPLAVLLDAAGQVVYRGSPVWASVASSLAKNLNLARRFAQARRPGHETGLRKVVFAAREADKTTDRLQKAKCNFSIARYYISSPETRKPNKARIPKLFEPWWSAGSFGFLVVRCFSGVFPHGVFVVSLC